MVQSTSFRASNAVALLRKASVRNVDSWMMGTARRPLSIVANVMRAS